MTTGRYAIPLALLWPGACSGESPTPPPEPSSETAIDVPVMRHDDTVEIASLPAPTATRLTTNRTSDPVSRIAEIETPARELVARLGIPERRDHVDASLELIQMARHADRVACGTVADISARLDDLEGLPTPLTTVTMKTTHEAPGQSPGSSALQFKYWGGAADGVQDTTSATPNADVGDRVCVFINEGDDGNWLSGQNAYAVVDGDGNAGIGQVRMTPERLVATTASLWNAEEGKSHDD